MVQFDYFIGKIWSHAIFYIQVYNLCHYCISCHLFHLQITMLPLSPHLSSLLRKKGQFGQIHYLKVAWAAKLFWKWRVLKQVVQKSLFSKSPYFICIGLEDSCVVRVLFIHNVCLYKYAQHLFKGFPDASNALNSLRNGALETQSSARWDPEWEENAKPLILEVVLLGTF